MEGRGSLRVFLPAPPLCAPGPPPASLSSGCCSMKGVGVLEGQGVETPQVGLASPRDKAWLGDSVGYTELGAFLAAQPGPAPHSRSLGPPIYRTGAADTPLRAAGG